MEENLINLDQEIYDWANMRLDMLLDIYGRETAQQTIKKRFPYFFPKKLKKWDNMKKNQFLVRNNQAWVKYKSALKEIYDYSHGESWNGQCKNFE